MCSRKGCVGCTIYTAVLFLLLFLLVFVIVPVIFMLSSELQRSIIFPTYLISPKNYSDSEIYGISGVRNIYIDIPNTNVSLGAWQILPQEIVSDIVKNDEYNFDGVLNNDKYHLLLYLHGNGADRVASVQLYDILREYFHIFAIDYRGYADSTGRNLTESNIVNDVVYVYKWLKDRSRVKIFVWGHSLGSAVATHVVKRLKDDNIKPAGLILETPFTSVVDVVKLHPIIKFYSFLPWRDTTLFNPIIKNDLNFPSKDYIKEVDCPIMILHAEDDEVIPYNIATELYYTAVNNRNRTYQGNVTYHLYGKDGYGHMFLYLENELPKHVRTFVQECLNFAQI